jgi:hypothetical protein
VLGVGLFTLWVFRTRAPRSRPVPARGFD